MPCTGSFPRGEKGEITMDSLSRYQIFCRIIEVGNFTRVAEQIHYSQSAVSQMVQSLERELGVTLVSRRKDGIVLTRDGEEFFPYIQQIAAAEDACQRKREEMQGLERAVITIGSFSSIGRSVLPPVMRGFKEKYPEVRFVIKQGDYSDIRQWIREDRVDFGFLASEAAGDLCARELYREPLMAVLPEDHPLAGKASVSLKELAEEPFIALDEGEGSSVRGLFARAGLPVREEYAVYDDYSILAMVSQGLGVSVLFEKVLQGFETGVAIRPITGGPERIMAAVWKGQSLMPRAAREFMEMLFGMYPALKEYS